jgi:GGDEF domain-containing protein
MQVFDRIDPQDLERREWHLWVLALATLAVFAFAIVLLMYPAIFLNPFGVSVPELRNAFFGFCTLSALLLAYLTNRHIMLARTRGALLKTQAAMLQAQKVVTANFLGSLPDLPLFQARLRAEFKRALLGQQPFSLVLVSVKAAASSLAADNELIAVIVAALKRKLRGDDLIYLLAPRVFCILLPGVTCENASRLRDRMTQALNEARASSGISFDTKLLNYPEQTNSLQGFEEGVRSFVGDGSPSLAAT